MTSKCQSGPTSLDYMHAIAYAQQQINRMKCEDPEIIEKICTGSSSGVYAGGGTCITWKQDAKQAAFPLPQNYYTEQCKDDSDCYQGKCKDGLCQCETDEDCSGDMTCKTDPENPSATVCSYDPDNVASGHCIFNNPTACKAQGQLPYTCDCGPRGNTVGTCTTRDQKDLNKPYTEWHTDESGKGKCVLGNFVLRQWCEEPCTRCTKDSETGEYPPSCTAGEHSRGVTDVPPFFYDENKGACYMTHDYCDWYAMRYNKGTCTSDKDCTEPDEHCAPDGYCTGPNSKCYLSEGDKIAQFLVGRTLFYMMKKGKTCVTETFEHDKRELEEGLSKKFNNTPESACFVYDPKKIKRERVIKQDFGGSGVHLYLFEKEDKVVTGFKANEIEKRYPEHVERNHDGTFLVCINRGDLSVEDKYLKRIYLSINSSSWITETLSSLIK